MPSDLLLFFFFRKYEEKSPPKLDQFVTITDNTYTKKQLLRMEQAFLSVLGFNLAAPTINSFLHLFMAIQSVCANTKNLALVSKLNHLTIVRPNAFKEYGYDFLFLFIVFFFYFCFLVCGGVKPAGNGSISTVQPIYSCCCSLLPSFLHHKYVFMGKFNILFG